MDKAAKAKISKSLENQRYREKVREKLESLRKEKELLDSIMSHLSEIHKSVVASMVMVGVDHYVGDADHTKSLAEGLKESKRDFLESIPEKELEQFVNSTKQEIASDKQAGKNLATYTDTVKELKTAEEAVVKAVKVRDQLLLNKKAILAHVSEKAIKAIQLAYADIGVEEKQKKRKEVAPSNESSQEVPTNTGLLSSLYSSVVGGAAKRPNTNP